MCQSFVCGSSCDGCPGEIFCALAEHRAHKRGQRSEKLRLMWRNNCERLGEKYFARAKGDVRQKCSGGYSLPMAEVRAKNISPLQMDDRVCKKVCEHIDDGQRPGRRSGDGVTLANVGAKNISPVQKVMCGRNRQAVMRHQWPTSGRKIFRPYKLMIGYAKIFANILMIGSGRGGDRVTEYQARA